jgi:chemotaxis protein methyltransferase CheR
MQDERAYQELCGILFSVSGIRMGEEKRALVESRLQRRLQVLGLKDLSEYLPYLEKEEERLELIEALTTHKTEWFREAIHYEYLAKEVEGWSRREPFYFWSAACSTGEELYSAAMVIMEKGASPRLLGTDISEKVVKEAEKGEFTGHRNPPLDSRTRPFLESNGKSFRVKPSVREVAKFRVQNLQNLSLPSNLAFDVIFLRNVLIYFSAETQERAILNVVTHLKPGGILAIGLSESLRKSYPELQPLGPSLFRKKAA